LSAAASRTSSSASSRGAAQFGKRKVAARLGGGRVFELDFGH
jgi:hypothetical protein